ncbi:RecBCD enzyme subunit RecB [Marinomonas aquimarina]|uniref:RecBCD enzyme subunit RecB n=1 Tax=Marinomonas aquimarina TaxID=295068 RepID=A0A1A8T8S2_9GAMM|nr:exodeoxyribonuclease V subunit beta [Marinomonas aquimarina]SBS27731.1 RecBCD enzyme subunit RecB [Marinomonas aquimarina]
MSDVTNQLNPLTFPLTSSALIEASAGTGKTYTLALLYLRLVLKHGGDNSFSDYLLPPNILVVTFTKAATRELRDRIRARLVEAANYFRLSQEPEKPDPLLQALKQDIAKEQDLNSAARRLDVAAEWMDEAAVSTIHSWCSRVLSEHAFYSGLNFQQTLIENEKPLIIQACEDYWREMVFTLDEPELRQVLSVFKSPNALYKKVNALIYKTEAFAKPEMELSDKLQAIEKDRAEQMASLKQQVQNALPSLIEGHEAATKNKLINGRSLNKKHLGDTFAALQKWVSSQTDSLSILYKLFDGKSFAKIALIETGHWKDPSQITIDQQAAAILAQLPEAIEQLVTADEFLICHSSHWVAERVEQEKVQRGVLSQNDLLSKLDKALQSEGGSRLAEVIRKQFPIALVDEFQDTDPVQYRIFNTIYNVAEPHPDTGFFMIGDPKQAIYRFRGADIFTYLAAKRDTGERQYTLTHNYRSAPDLVASVNHFFEHAEAMNPKGAFLFKDAGQDPIPFQPVGAGKKDEIELLIHGERCAVQNLWGLTPEESEDEKEAKAPDRAKVTANEVASLLNLSQAGHATINLGEGARALQPKDFAILVNSGNEARQIRRALFELNIASVYLSDASDVFDTDEADDVLRLLRAMAEPFNSFHLRVALGSRLMGLSLSDLDRLNHDELFWEGFIELFRGYHQHWYEFGIMAVLHRFFTEQHVTGRYLTEANGERSITDLFHISELLQQASETIQGQQALIHHLEQRITTEKSGEESTQQRLESDADLVQVVTVHKSKGLQYPIVMLPFLDYARPVKSSDFPIEYHDEMENLALTFQAKSEEVKLADAERLAEDVRKIYVAMTRAICAQWMAIGDPKRNDDGEAVPLTAAAHVLLGVSDCTVVDRASKMADTFTLVAVKGQEASYQSLDELAFRPARQVQNLGIEPWWIASYSSFTYGGKEGLEFPTSTLSEQPVDEQLTDDEDVLLEEQPLTSKGEKVMHRLPRGSHIGTFLHGILEWAAEQRFQTPEGERLLGFAAAQADSAGRLDMLQGRCRKRQLEAFVPELSSWLAAFLGTTWQLNQLPSSKSRDFRLIDLHPKDVAVELEFMFAANAVHSQRLDALVRQYTWGGLERPAANYQQLEGMFKGFIDLVAQIDGQYYVIDWKSNYLGEHDADYDLDSLKVALLKKRYDLQYVLYLVALHRHLQDRIPNYDYDQHVGGAVYFFLRGFENPESQGLIMDKPPKALIEKLDAMFAGENAAEAMQQEFDYV